MFWTSIFLVVLAMSWITFFSLAAQWFQNRNHRDEWVCTLDVHPHMLQMLLWFSIPIQDMYLRSFMPSLTMILPQFLTYARPLSHHIGQIWFMHPQNCTYTKRQVDTWQSLSELITENGDFTSEQTEVPNAVLGTHTNDAASSNSEGAKIASIPAHLPMS